MAVPAERGSRLRRPKRLLALRSDERLVEHLRAGDDDAFEVLYERHVAGVLGFCRHMLGGQHEAEDAVQQAFVSAHGAMLRGSREIAFKPWLYTIARNRCLSMLRARREVAVEAPEPEPSIGGLHDEVAQRADLRELVGDVQRLPDDQRAALVLSELGDLSHAEIADVLGCEVATVKGTVFRARSALIERHEARDADCGEIREELAAATGGGLRKSRLRFHLESCPGCTAYLEDLRRQRKLLGLALPAVPTLALHDSVMASVGIGTASAGAAGVVAGGAATTAGIPLIGGTAAKVAVIGVIAVGGAGVATEVVRESGSGPTPASEQGDDRSGASEAPAAGAGGNAIAGDRREGARGDERRERGQRISRERSDGHSNAGSPNGKALGQSDAAPGQRRGQSGENPGKALGKDKAKPTPPPNGGGGSGSGQGGTPPAKSPPQSQSGGGGRPAVERAPPDQSSVPVVPPAKGKGAPKE